MSTPFISVIVPVYNGERFLPRCIDALLSNSYPAFEVIAVDDGCTDGSVALLSERNVRIVESERPRSGPAAARNLASKAARGEILLFVDADVVVKDDTIGNVAETFELHPEIAALFGSYDNEPAEPNFLSQYKNLQHHFVHQTSSTEASTFWAGLGAVRSDIFRSLGGFDDLKYAEPSIEDIELGVRLRQAGHRIRLEPSIQAKHLKKWEIVSLFRTEIFCRALPWSKLILTRQGLINDLNLKTSDRISTALVGLSLLSLPIGIWKPPVIVLSVVCLLSVAILNRRILQFFAMTKGVPFAIGTFPLQLSYFLYSGAAFAYSWLRYGLPNLARTPRVSPGLGREG